MAKTPINKINVRKVADVLRQLDRAPGQTIESGRVGVRQAENLPDLRGMIDRIFSRQPAIRDVMRRQLEAGQQSAAATRKQVAAAMEVAAAKRAPASSAGASALSTRPALGLAPPAPSPAAPTSLSPAGPSPPPTTFTPPAPPTSPPAPPTTIPSPPSETPAPSEPEPSSGGGPRILVDYSIPPPHTLTTKAGKYCETFRWFNSAFLVYDPSIPSGEHGSELNPWFGLAGPGFRCYYPQSTDADFESCMTSGSSGRWLHAWPQKSNYVNF